VRHFWCDEFRYDLLLSVAAAALLLLVVIAFPTLLSSASTHRKFDDVAQASCSSVVPFRDHL
jgi:hypothetical protein